MSNSLIDLIRQKKAQITQLQKELDDALGELTRVGGGNGSAPDRPQKHGRRAHARPATPTLFSGEAADHDRRRGVVPTSTVGRSIEAIRQAGKPLHVKELLKRLDADGHKVNKSTLVGNLSRYVKLKQVFYRPGPSVYGLLEHRRQ